MVFFRKGRLHTGDFNGDFLYKAVFLNSVFINKHVNIIPVPPKNSRRKLLYSGENNECRKKLSAVINKSGENFVDSLNARFGLQPGHCDKCSVN